MSQQTPVERTPKNKEQANEQDKLCRCFRYETPCCFPHAVLPLTVGRESSVQLINSLGEDKTIIVVGPARGARRFTAAQRLVYGRNFRRRSQSRKDAQPEPVCVCRRPGTGEAWREFTQLTPFMSAHYSRAARGDHAGRDL